MPTLDEYLQKKYVPGKPTVGLWFYQSLWQAGNTVFVDRLIEQIEQKGANVIPVFLHSLKDVERGTQGARTWVVDNFFIRDGKSLIDVLISHSHVLALHQAAGKEKERQLPKISPDPKSGS